MIANAEPIRAHAAEGEFEPTRVVDAILRLLAKERVPIAISSVSRARESAQQLLQNLGVAPAPMGSGEAYWWGVHDAVAGASHTPDSRGRLGVRP